MSRAHTPTPPQIIDEASEWFVIMRDSSVSAESNGRFAEWLRASPVHLSAYLEIARLWADAARVDSRLPADPPKDSPANVLQLREDGGTSNRPGSARSPRRGPRGKAKVLVAACVLVALLAAGGGWWPAERAFTYATDVGEQRALTLADGSTVRLNSRSELRVHMSPEVREIELVDGQALFEVAHDSARPFIVMSGNVAVRAVGTQFDVNQRRSGTVVTVVEGRVSVNHAPRATFPLQVTGVAAGDEGSGPKPAHSAEIVLAAGDQIRVARNGALERTTRPDTATAISWPQQELRFDDEPLGDVIEELNRYSRTPLVLYDPTLATLRINAVFHTTNPDSLLRFISRFDGVKVEKADEEIRISRAE